jgi:ribosome-associated protein
MLFIIPDAELRFRASRSAGPGGQHVNKVSTRINVRWNVVESSSLTDLQRQRVLKNLANRIDARGWISVSSGATRSQTQNRVRALERLHQLIGDALKVAKSRKKTRPSRAAKAARFRDKKKRSKLKADRKPVGLDD